MVENTASSVPVFPGGTVTFLFTDIEGSTQLLKQLRSQYELLISGHHQIIRDALTKWSGREVDTQGDAFFAVFPKASEAINAVVEIQRAMSEEIWPEGVQVRVRMGLHTGEPWLVSEGYMGMDVHRAARIGHVGYGGQVLLSETTTALVQDEMPEGVALMDLGRHRLKDMRRPEAIHQLVIEGLPSEFPPLKSLEALPALQPPPDDTEAPGAPRKVGPSPYRGLAAFRENDAELFFGREAFVEQLSEAVGERHLVAVIVGPSGSGKSSTVFAGLLPQLREEGQWLIVETRPGSRPFYALAGALIHHLENETSETKLLVETQRLAQAMRSGELGLFHVANRILAQDETADRLLLVIDQFEELFTHKPDPDAQRYFLDELIAAAEAGSSYRRSPLVILLTLRADFMGQALGHRPFADALQEGSLILGPMNRDELRAAVEKPAELAGAAFETGLIQRILDDVGQEPGNLPLLEFALTLLWERMEQGWMTHAAYDEIGRVDGALARYAEEVWTELDADEQGAARLLLVQLVQPGEGTEDTRRVAKSGELAESHWPLVQHLADKRLVVTGRDEAGGETVEVVHEALIRGWDRLGEWMMHDRAFRTWQEGLRVAQRGWEASDRDSGALLRGAPLALALEWMDQNEAALAPSEKEFIEASNREKRRMVAEEEARRQRELETAQKLAETEHARAEEQAQSAQSLRRRAYILGGVLVIAAIMAIAAIFFARQSNESADLAAAREAEAVSEKNMRSTSEAVAITEADRRATSEAIAVTEGDRRATSEAAAIDETNLRATAEADALLQRDIAQEQRQEALRQASIGLAALAEKELGGIDRELGVLLALEALENYPFTAQAAGALALSIEEYRSFQELDASDSVAELIMVADWSSDGSKIAAGSNASPNSIIIWDSETGAELLSTNAHEGLCQEGFNQMHDLAWSPSGDRLAVIAKDVQSGRSCGLVVLDTSSGEVLLSQPDYESPARSLDWSPDGSAILSGHEDGMVRIWDAQSGQELSALQGHSGVVNDAVYSPDGTVIASAGEDGTVRIVDADSGEVLQILSGHAGEVRSIAWSPDGSQLVTGGDDGLPRVWDADSGEVLFVLPGHMEGVVIVTWSADGRRIASQGLEAMVKVWDAATGGPLFQIPNAAPEPSTKRGYVAFSPDSQRILTGSSRVLGPRIWDADMTTPKLFGHTFGQEWGGWSADGTLIATSGEDDAARLWDATTGQQLGAFEGGSFWGDWAPDGERLIFADGIGAYAINIWEARSGQKLATLSPPDDGLASPQFLTMNWSPDGAYIAGAAFRPGTPQPIYIWNAETGELVTSLESGDVCMQGWPRWSPDSKYIASGCIFVESGINTPARIWDVATGKETLTLDSEYGWTFRTVWSPDGSELLVGYENGVVQIWDLEKGAPALTFTGHQGATGGEWSPDGTLIASSDYAEQTVKIWNSKTGEELFSFSVPGAPLNIEWSPDGKYIIVPGDGMNEPVIKQVWHSADDIIAHARECCVTRDLTPEERADFGLPNRP